MTLLSRTRLFSFLLAAALVVLLVVLLLRERQVERPQELMLTTTGMVEMCLSCHRDEVLDSAHDRLVLGCSPCHLGDSMAIDQDKAHKGMVMNPGDLRVVERTCGVSGCHPEDVLKVKNSLMATNRGILATLLYYWGEREDHNADITVEQLLESGENSLALDYFRKLCASCHLWKQKNDYPEGPDFYNAMGGGCTACHSVPPPGTPRGDVRVDVASQQARAAEQGGEEQGKARGRSLHPLIIKKVPEENCIRCHNRSGRVGLSYIGVFEAEGYGTPLAQGKPSPKQLDGDRFYLSIAEDIHHKAQMACIDCHSRDEIMGDGTSYAHYEEQLEVTCVSCHASNPGLTTRKQPLANVEKSPEGSVLVGKLDGIKRALKPPKDTCRYEGHQRLTCVSCHATWVPQCYGCHVKRDKRETHLDKLLMKETAGWWEEGRSYMRYEQPMLAVWGEQVVIVTPGCQDLVTLIDEKGRSEGGFNRFTMAAINPHTTQARGRDCKDCHASPKTVGLGEGTVTKKDGKWEFFPVNRGVESGQGKTVGLDNFVTIEGEALQYGSRANLRPFNRQELHNILRIGLCLDCHSSLDDPAYRDYTPKVVCPVFVEP